MVLLALFYHLLLRQSFHLQQQQELFLGVSRDPRMLRDRNGNQL